MTQVVTVREDTGRRRVQTVYEDESLTVQSERGQAELKTVLSRYEATGALVNMRDVDLVYRDVSEFEDYSDMQFKLREAEAAFMKLPSKVREIFGHDAGRWLDAAHSRLDDEQRAKLEELGVLEAVEDPADVPASDEEPVSGEAAK